MPHWGISRVTDITRLDRLGLPVHASVRPRGLALCVHAGKGLEREDSRVGALMEAIEFAVAEPDATPWEGRDLSVAELRADWNGAFDLHDLTPVFGAPIDAGRRLRALRCDDVAGRGAAWLPAELVFMPYDDPHGPPLFGWSSNGLASGNTLAEATLHALLEVLERDALAMNLPRDRSAWVEPRDYPPPFDALAAGWRELGVETAVRQVPNEFGLPCFQCLLLEDSRAQTVDLADGSGLHLDARIALARAICEAAQSRLSVIHGGRDDITDFYDHVREQRGTRDARRTLAAREGFDRRHRVRWDDVPSWPLDGAEPLDALLTRLVLRLQAQGFPRVLRHRFDAPLGGLHVVKVVVPRCEEAAVPLQRAGRRLLDRARADG